MWAVEPTGMQTEQSAPHGLDDGVEESICLHSQYYTGNGVEESVFFLLLSLYDLEFGVEESTGPAPYCMFCFSLLLGPVDLQQGSH